MAGSAASHSQGRKAGDQSVDLDIVEDLRLTFDENNAVMNQDDTINFMSVDKVILEEAPLPDSSKEIKR